MNKTVKIEILKSTNIDWEEFGNILFNLREESRKIKNHTIALYHEWILYTMEYHDAHGQWPKIIDVHPPYKLPCNYIYNMLKHEKGHMSANTFQSSIRNAIAKYDIIKKDIMAGRVSVPSMGEGQPIDIVGRDIKIWQSEEKEKNYMVSFPIVNENTKKKFGLPSCTAKLILSVKDKSQKTILNRCISGEYHICGSQIIYETSNKKDKKTGKKKSKVWLYLCYNFEPEKVELDDNRIMGIDLGMKIPAVMAFNFDDKKYATIDDNRIIERKVRLDKVLSEAKHACQWRCGGNSGHGRKKKVDVYERYANKSHNLSMTINHEWSKFIVETAVKNKCGVIQMEDLSGIKASRQNFLGNWTYYDLQQKIMYKAEEKGIKVIKVEPSYTSQMCPVCGYINKRNRATQAEFSCLECGHTANADYNAARNIATPDIANVIKNRITKQTEEGMPID